MTADSLYTIEQIQRVDIREATQMRMQSWRDTYTNESEGVTKEWLDALIADEISENRMQEREQRPAKGWVARVGDGKIMGVSMPFVMEDGIQRVGGLYVAKEWHGKGVGSALMQKAIDFHDPAKPIVLGVATYNDHAIVFYKKWGFTKIPDSVEMFRDKIPTVRMIRKATK